MRAVGYRKSLPIDDPSSLLDIEIDKPVRARTRDAMSAHLPTAAHRWTSSGGHRRARNGYSSLSAN